MSSAAWRASYLNVWIDFGSQPPGQGLRRAFRKIALSARLRFALARPQSLFGSLDPRQLAEVATAIAGAAGRPNEKAWFACCRLANARSRPPPSGPELNRICRIIIYQRRGAELSSAILHDPPLGGRAARSTAVGWAAGGKAAGDAGCLRAARRRARRFHDARLGADVAGPAGSPSAQLLCLGETSPLAAAPLVPSSGEQL